MNVLLLLLVVLVMTVIAPVGLRLLGTGLPAQLLRVWPWVGLLAGLALLLPRGAAVLLCVPYAACCAVAAALGARRALAWHEDPVRELAAFTATSSLLVAGTALVVERVGVELLGFDLVTWRLTVLHFHVAGFAAAVLVGLTWVATRRRLAAYGAVSVPVGTALVGAGFFLGEWAELVGALVLTSGLLCSSWVLLRHVVRWGDDGGKLLALAAAVTPFTMALAVWWALGEATGLPHLTLTQTAATHGVVSALCVGLCGVLGWTSVTEEAL